MTVKEGDDGKEEERKKRVEEASASTDAIAAPLIRISGIPDFPMISI